MKTSFLNVNHEGQAYIGFEFSALPLAAALSSAKDQIDQSADQARLSVLGDPLRAFEYQITAQEAEAFASENYEGAAPPTVQAWMDAASLSAEAATDSILAESAAWLTALRTIRALRLKGKQDLLKATSHAQAEAIADEAINAIAACIVGVGNAA